MTLLYFTGTFVVEPLRFAGAVADGRELAAKPAVRLMFGVVVVCGAWVFIL